MIDVILETGENRRNMIQRAVTGLGSAFVDRIKSAKVILIKPNLIHHELQLATIHVDAVRGVIDVIRQHSRAPIVVGDASYTGTKAAFRHFGYHRLVDEYDDVTLLDLNDDETVEGYCIRADGSHASIFRSKQATEADVKISVAPMKTHRDLGVSLSVENWVFGTWIVPSRIGMNGRVWARWPWLQAEGQKAQQETMASLFAQLPCDVAIVDGVVGMEGDGPISGRAVPMGVVLAGMDPVAVDAVACTLMGIDPHDVGYLSLCQDQQSGIIDLGKVNVPPILVAQHTKPFARPAM